MELTTESMTLDELANAVKAEGRFDQDHYIALALDTPSYTPPRQGFLSRLRKGGTGELYRHEHLAADGAQIFFKYWFDGSVTDIRINGNKVDNYRPEYQHIGEQMGADYGVEHSCGGYSIAPAPQKENVTEALKKVKSASRDLGMMLCFMENDVRRDLASWARE